MKTKAERKVAAVRKKLSFWTQASLVRQIRDEKNQTDGKIEDIATARIVHSYKLHPEPLEIETLATA